MQFPNAALLGLLPLVKALDLTVYLPAKPNPYTLPPTTHATLDVAGKHLTAPLSTVNTFVFRYVEEGSYLLEVHCMTDAFQPLRVDVFTTADGSGVPSVQAWETYRGNDWDNKGASVEVKEGSVGKGVEVRALGGKGYFIERPKFSVLAILKNPMILMGLVSMVIFFGMPYLMDNMDPELKAEFEASQKNSPLNAAMSGQQGQNPLGNFDMAAYLAGSGKKDGGNGNGGGAAAAKGQQGVRR